MSKFLVTGAAGFIGSNIVQTLLDQNHHVLALDNLSNGSEANLSFVESHPNKASYHFIKGDVRDLATCQSACKNIDYVLHQAALGSVPESMEKPQLYEENNTQGTLNMMLAAKENRVKRFVFASSTSVYGNCETMPVVETLPLSPLSPYAATKAAKELYSIVFHQSYGLETVGLRYFNVFGQKQNPKSQYAAAVPIFITTALKNKPITIFGDGEQTRDFIFVDNVVKANILACTCDSSACGQAYNIGCGEKISINDLVQSILKITNSKSTINYEDERAGDIKHSLAFTKKAEQLLGLTDTIKLDKGLLKTIEWYKNAIN